MNNWNLEKKQSDVVCRVFQNLYTISCEACSCNAEHYTCGEAVLRYITRSWAGMLSISICVLESAVTFQSFYLFKMQ